MYAPLAVYIIFQINEFCYNKGFEKGFVMFVMKSNFLTKFICLCLFKLYLSSLQLSKQ